jgi:hypothetical protein
MPGFDGTGPRGQGPMTGWGRGYCAMSSSGGMRRPFFGWGFWGRGGGRGLRHWHWRTGFPGWARADYAYPASGVSPNRPGLAPNEEMDMLKQEAELLKAQLEDIQSRIETLEKTEKTAKPDA